MSLTTDRELVCVTVYDRGLQYLIVNGEASKQVCTEIALAELARVEYGIDFKELEFSPNFGSTDCFSVKWYRKG